MTNVPNTDLWCHVCQRQFCSNSALLQHGKRLSHLKRAMKYSTSRCTTITNGKISSSTQRSTPISPSLQSLPSSSNSETFQESNSVSTASQGIIIKRRKHSSTNSTSYTCSLCSCCCWSIRTIHRHIRLHADVRPFHCNLCQMKFKSHANLIKHLKTSRHKLQNEQNLKPWTIDTQAAEEQTRLIRQAQFVDDDQHETDESPSKTMSEKLTTDDGESDNFLEDLQIPDSRLIDGDAADLALIDPSTFEELHKAAECLLNLQGVLYFGEEESGTERVSSFASN